ncbi:MAG: RNA 2',3'-cyclic phosphodiesterase [Crenarchaeota archaeon]|nr:RNA 2',3'-cyclic phosphodiesterase [Thermoproteota archaeon]MDW8034313.1 RNA 2',3'-cyclic phosphodiesterase [Nitrososphaerota archaeon]
MVRVFVSLDIEDEKIGNRVSEIQRRMVETRADLKLVDTKILHITLFFIGEVHESMVKELCNALSKVEGHQVEIELRGIGAFPTVSQPRVVFAKINKGFDKITERARRVSETLLNLGLRMNEDFSPHITLARVKSRMGVDRLVTFIRENADILIGETLTSRLRLKKSTLTPKGPIYETLWEKID